MFTKINMMLFIERRTNFICVDADVDASIEYRKPMLTKKNMKSATTTAVVHTCIDDGRTIFKRISSTFFSTGLHILVLVLLLFLPLWTSKRNINKIIIKLANFVIKDRVGFFELTSFHLVEWTMSFFFLDTYNVIHLQRNWVIREFYLHFIMETSDNYG